MVIFYPSVTSRCRRWTPPEMQQSDLKIRRHPSLAGGLRPACDLGLGRLEIPEIKTIKSRTKPIQLSFSSSSRRITSSQALAIYLTNPQRTRGKILKVDCPTFYNFSRHHKLTRALNSSITQSPQHNSHNVDSSRNTIR
jgi:hypothetical protein